jgi:hypothetical protein
MIYDRYENNNDKNSLKFLILKMKIENKFKNQD